MKFLPLIWAGVWSKPWRAVLTFLTVANAFLLFGLLQSFIGGLDRAAASGNAEMILTTSKVSQFEFLPLSLRPEIAGLDTVRAVSPIVNFQGYYQRPAQKIRVFAVDSATLPATTPSLLASPPTIGAMQHNPRGVIVSEDLAARYHWKPGQQLPLTSLIWRNSDGSKVWPVQIVGIYRSKGSVLLKSAILMNFNYLDEARQNDRGTTSRFLIRLKDATDAVKTERKIDGLFANSPYETLTAAESQFAVDGVKAVADFGSLSRGAIVAMGVALLFSVGTSFFQAVHERTREIAVLKVVGFTNPAVMLLLYGEALLIFCLASVVGLGVSAVLFKPMVHAIGLEAIEPSPVIVWGLVGAVLLALASSSPPVIGALRLRTADALADR
jgi:putative ABC transport system permease protein